MVNAIDITDVVLPLNKHDWSNNGHQRLNRDNISLENVTGQLLLTLVQLGPTNGNYGGH